jgi:predicted DNA-binding mobile mystery protein A
MKTSSLKVNQIERLLKPWRTLLYKQHRRNNWLKTIRETLGISATYLADKMKVSQANISIIEKSEINDNITLKSLKKYAQAMDCELVYAIVPKSPLNGLLEDRARKVARKRLEPVAHSMSLEDQSVDKGDLKARYEQMIKELLIGDPKHLWNSHYD